jgi:hypothetical protein
MIGQFWIAGALSLAAAAGTAAGEMAHSCSAASSGATPTSFDFLVLASIADSSHPISIASYRPACQQAAAAWEDSARRGDSDNR